MVVETQQTGQQNGQQTRGRQSRNRNYKGKAYDPNHKGKSQQAYMNAGQNPNQQQFQPQQQQQQPYQQPQQPSYQVQGYAQQPQQQQQQGGYTPAQSQQNRQPPQQQQQSQQPKQGGKYCELCNMTNHFNDMCWKYKGEMPGQIRCENCRGRHQGPCKLIKAKSSQGGYQKPAQQNIVNAGFQNHQQQQQQQGQAPPQQAQDGRLANDGYQTKPAGTGPHADRNKGF